MNTGLKRKDTAILASVAMQIVALVFLAFLETFGREQRLGIRLAIQVVWPILLTLDAVYNWSRVPAFRGIAVILNFLYGCMFGLGVLAGAVGLMRETSWISFGRFTLMVTITATYLLNAFLLMPAWGSLRLRPPKSDGEGE